jgi:two-component system, LuxR family, response regulator FixJ
MQSDAEFARKNATVAIIEDDFAVRNALAFALQTDGLSVRAYGCAEDLLKDGFIAEIDCLVVDYKLPNMNGLDLLKELRRRGIDAPAILIATEPSPAVRAAAALMGASIVEKPLLTEELYDLIALELRRPARST